MKQRILALFLCSITLFSSVTPCYAMGKTEEIAEEEEAEVCETDVGEILGEDSETTLLVQSDGMESTYGATSAGVVDDFYVLSYESSEEKDKAKEQLLLDGVSVEENRNLSLVAENEDTESDSTVEDGEACVSDATTRTLAEEDDTAIDSDSIIIAVLDTGIDVNAEGIAPYLVQWNEESQSFQRLTQEDVNAYSVDTESAYFDKTIFDDGSWETKHGTEMAEVMVDTLSDIPNVYLYPIKAFDENNQSTVGALVGGIYDAMEKGVNYISISASGMGESTLLSTAIQRARAEGIRTIVSAGNDGADVCGYVPGNIADAITVGAADSDGVIQSFSNYGELVDCYADGRYALTDEEAMPMGTSYASARVTAYLAAMQAYDLQGDSEAMLLTLLNEQKVLSEESFQTCLSSLHSKSEGEEMKPSEEGIEPEEKEETEDTEGTESEEGTADDGSLIPVDTAATTNWVDRYFEVHDFGDGGSVWFNVTRDAISNHGAAGTDGGANADTIHYTPGSGTVTVNMPLIGYSQWEGPKSASRKNGGQITFSTVGADPRSGHGGTTVLIHVEINCGAIGGNGKVHYTPFLKATPGSKYGKRVARCELEGDWRGDGAGANRENSVQHTHVENNPTFYDKNEVSMYFGFGDPSMAETVADGVYFVWDSFRYNVTYEKYMYSGREEGYEALGVCPGDQNDLLYEEAHYAADGSGLRRRSTVNLNTNGGNLNTTTLYAYDSFHNWKADNGREYSSGGGFNGEHFYSISDSTPAAGLRYTMHATYNDDGIVSLPAPTRAGYTFLGWTTDSGSTAYGGDVYKYYQANGWAYNDNGAGYNWNAFTSNAYNPNGPKVTLYAVWRPNIYHIVFHGNGNTGGDKQMRSNIDAYIASSKGAAKYYQLSDGTMGVTVNAEMTSGLPSCGFTRDDYKTRGWDLNSKNLKAAYEENWNSNSYATVGIGTIVSDAGVTNHDQAVIHLYEIWDNAPYFESAKNVYFTRTEAENGITAQMILDKSVKVLDDNDSPYIEGNYLKNDGSIDGSILDDLSKDREDKVWVCGLEPEHLKHLGSSGFIAYTIMAEDYVGNTCNTIIRVYVVDDEAEKTQTEENGSLELNDDGSVSYAAHYVRYIDLENYKKNDPKNGPDKKNWVSPHKSQEGGLEDYSIFYWDDDARAELVSILENAEKTDHRIHEDSDDQYFDYVADWDADTWIKAGEWAAREGTMARDYLTSTIARSERSEVFYDTFMTKVLKKAPGQYEVAYDGNGASGGSMNNKRAVVDDRVSLDKCNYYRVGYVFAGWSTSADGEVEYLDGERIDCIGSENSVVTLFAVWKKATDTFTIVYEGNGATSGLTTNETVYIDAPWTVSDCSFEKSGYSFTYWLGSDGRKYKPDDDVTNIVKAGDVLTLYAQWEKWNYTVKYDLNGGSGDSSSQKKIYGQDLQVHGAPTKDGYVFAGWKVVGASDAKQNGNIIKANGKLTYDQNGQDVMLVAQWTQLPVNVTFVANDGSGKTKTEKVYIGKTLPKNTFKNKYKGIKGWSYKEDSEVVFTDGSVFTLDKWQENIKLYAQWERDSYTIKYDLNGGTAQKGVSYTDQIKTVGGDAVYAYAGPKKAGMAFSGWLVKGAANEKYNGKCYAGGQEIDYEQIDGSITLVAQYTKDNVLTLHYNANGGTGEMDDAYLYQTGGTVYIDENEFTRTGYKFKNWNTKADGSGKTITDTISPNSFGNKKELTLYAQWELATYTITFKNTVTNNNGVNATGSMSKQTLTYGQNGVLNRNKYALANADFIGWNTKEDGSGTSFSDGQTVSKITSTYQKDVTLYAQWRTVKVTVYHNVESGLSTNYYNLKDTTYQYSKANVNVAASLKSYGGYQSPSQTSTTAALTGTPSRRGALLTYLGKWVKYYYTVNASCQNKNSNNDGNEFAGTYISLEGNEGWLCVFFNNRNYAIPTWTTENGQDDLDWNGATSGVDWNPHDGPWNRTGHSYNYVKQIWRSDHANRSWSSGWNIHIYGENGGVGAMECFPKIDISYANEGSGFAGGIQSKTIGAGINLRYPGTYNGHTFVGWSTSMPNAGTRSAEYAAGQYVGHDDWHILTTHMQGSYAYYPFDANTAHARNYGGGTLYGVWKTNPHSDKN